MTPEAQRIAIACFMWGRVDCQHYAKALRDQYKHKGDKTDFSGTPNYLNDLNWMHEAEKALTTEQRSQYSLLLHDSTEPAKIDFLARDFAVLHSTAAQRAEAFLKTLGKWTD